MTGEDWVELDLGTINTVAKVHFGMERSHQDQRHTIGNFINQIASIEQIKITTQRCRNL
jgi:hypothetical protein